MVSGLITAALIIIGLVFLFSVITERLAEGNMIRWAKSLVSSEEGTLGGTKRSGWSSSFNFQARFLIEEGRELYLIVGRDDDGIDSPWYYKVGCLCKNPQKLTLSIDRATTLSSRKNDIEVFNERFDKTFIVQSNQRTFPIKNFSDDFCNRFLRLYSPMFQDMGLKGNSFEIKVARKPQTSEAGKQQVRKIMAMCKEIAAMIDNFKLER